MKKSKYIIVSLLIGCGSLSQAASKTANMSVTTKVNSGCFITASNMDFGPITASGQSASAPLTIRCSKDTQVNITGSDRNNPGQVYGPRMWRVGETVDKHETRIRYGVMTSSITSNTNVQVVKQARDNYLWNYGGPSYDYNLTIKLLTGEAVTLPIFGIIDSISTGTNIGSPNRNFVPTEVIPGNYYDEFTYKFDF